MDDNRLEGTRGTCAVLMGDGVEAVRILSHVLARTPPTLAAERSILLTDLAGAHAQAGDVEHACDLLGRSLELGKTGTPTGSSGSCAFARSTCAVGRGCPRCECSTSGSGWRRAKLRRAVKDLYRILQVDPDADPETIKAAYRDLARRFHPDGNLDPAAAQRMKEINEAYGVLGIAGRRAEYDRLRRAEAAEAAEQEWFRRRPSGLRHPAMGTAASQLCAAAYAYAAPVLLRRPTARRRRRCCSAWPASSAALRSLRWRSS